MGASKCLNNGGATQGLVQNELTIRPGYPPGRNALSVVDWMRVLLPGKTRTFVVQPAHYRYCLQMPAACPRQPGVIDPAPPGVVRDSIGGTAWDFAPNQVERALRRALNEPGQGKAVPCVHSILGRNSRLNLIEMLR